MMEAFIATLAHSRAQTLKLVADLSEEQMTLQQREKVNHPAWVLGHLLLVEYSFLGLIGGGAAPAWIDEAWRATYGMNSVPVADKAKYRSKEFYLAKLAEARGKIVERLRAMRPEEFDREHPDPARRERFPTVGHAVMLYGTWHEAYHAGQLSTWRRVLGMPAV